MKQMRVSTPVFGLLTGDCALPDGGECKVDELIHPKVRVQRMGSTSLRFV